MTNRKISQLPGFVGKNLALAAEKRGVEICAEAGLTKAESVILIGLISLLVERGIIKEEKGP